MCIYTKSLQSCPTLCNPMDCSPPGSSVHGILSPSKNTGVGGHVFLQGIFPTPVSYVSCIGRLVLYHYHHQKACVCVCVYLADFSHQSSSVYSSLFELPEVRWAFKCCIFLNTKKVIKCIYCHSTLAESGTASQVPTLKML